jgi:hypothetical protein
VTGRSVIRVVVALLLGGVAAAPIHASAQDVPQETRTFLRTSAPRTEASHESSRSTTHATPDAEGARALGRVIIEERMPEAWWSTAEASYPLEPERQRRRMPRRCRTRGGYRQFCGGERVVPTPTGPAAELAAWLGLGHRATAMSMMHHEALPEWMAAVEGLDADTHLTFPVPVGHMGRGFGFTRDAGLAHTRHDGVDIGAPEGSTIVAARGGLVAYADNGITGMGNVLIVLHADGSSALYAHCVSISVFAGQYVERGQPVALVGQTGFARAPHLHFEWRTRGHPRDPSRQFHSRERDDDDESPAEEIAAADDVALATDDE